MKIADKIADSMYENHIIEQDEIEIYRFGTQLLLETLFSFLVFLIIAAFFGRVTEMIIFTISFALLRQYAGGSHSKTFLGCFAVSCLMFSSLYIPLNFTGDGTVFICIGSALSLPVIAVLSPVDSVYKPIDKDDRQKYRKRLLILLCAEVIAAVFLYFFVKNIYVICIVYSWCVLAASLTAGRIQNKILKR